MSANKHPISQALRKALDDFPNSRAASEATGIDHAVIYRFTTGQRDLSLANADRLAAALGLELRPATRKTQP